MLNAPDKITRVVFYCSFIIIIGILSYFVFGEVFMPSEGHHNSFRCEVYSNPWFYTNEDGSQTQIELPYDFHTPT